MRVLFVSNNFPPEVNAPATRLHEHAKQWADDGHEIEVLTSVPNFPEGEVYDGYQNRYAQVSEAGIDVIRVPMYVTANQGTLKRTLSYLSFMLSAILYHRRVRKRPDVIVATSPQFFAAVAGLVISRLFQVPFVMEVRDLWPESIVAVGAMRRGLLIRSLERLELFLYSKAEHIVVVTDAFKRFIQQKGIAPKKISVLKNGANLQAYSQALDPVKLGELRSSLGLDGKFVASYVGTIGMAHRADVLLEAAERCSNPDIVFMVVGTGAERRILEERAAALNLENFRLVDKQPRDLIPYLLALTDVSVVHLRASPLFETVIPSKIFESMAMSRPIILGVEGESREIVERAGAGIPIPPEDADALASAVELLHRDRALLERYGSDGRKYVHQCHDRKVLARRYWSLLENLTGSERDTSTFSASRPCYEGTSEFAHIDASVG